MQRDTEIPDLISVTEAAELLGMSRQAVHKRIDTDQIPAAQVGQQVVLRRDLVVQIAAQEGTLLTWGDLAVLIGLDRETGAERVARNAGALTPHDPRTGRIPQPWTGQGMGCLLTRAQAEEIAAGWHRAAASVEAGAIVPIINDAETPESLAELASRYRP